MPEKEVYITCRKCQNTIHGKIHFNSERAVFEFLDDDTYKKPTAAKDRGG